jgi:hypothetical protein
MVSYQAAGKGPPGIQCGSFGGAIFILQLMDLAVIRFQTMENRQENRQLGGHSMSLY